MMKKCIECEHLKWFEYEQNEISGEYRCGIAGYNIMTNTPCSEVNHGNTKLE